MLVKICTNTNLDNLRQVLSYHPDFIGLIFTPKSKHYLAPTQALSLSDLAHHAGVPVVGVYQNQSPNYINQQINQFQLDYVQLHGQETPEQCQAITAPIIKAINVSPDDTYQTVKSQIVPYFPDHPNLPNTPQYILLDRSPRGEGPPINPQLVKQLSQEFPLILSGGLTPDNINDILSQVGNKLVGVDVASGLESAPGIKDPQLIKQFVAQITNNSNHPFTSV